MSSNKRGFSTKEEVALMNIIGLGQRAAAIVTGIHQTDLDLDQIKEILLDLASFAKDKYPLGPRELAESMNEIARFCDLPMVTSVRNMDTGKPL